LLGFVKALFTTEISKQVLGISKLWPDVSIEIKLPITKTED